MRTQKAGAETRFRATEEVRACPKLAEDYVVSSLFCQPENGCSREARTPWFEQGLVMIERDDW